MRSTMIIMSLLFAAWVGYEKPETQIVKNYEYTKTEAEMDAAEQENRKWFESDKEWADRRTKSNSTLEVTIERTDQSVFNEEGLLLAGIYYDRPVVTGDTVAAEKITEFFEDEEMEWFLGFRSPLDFKEEDTNYYNHEFGDFLYAVQKMRQWYGDEDVAEWPCIYSIETRIVYMDDDILSIMQIMEKRTERREYNYFGSTFDLNTGELLKLTDLTDMSSEDVGNILSEVGYPAPFNELSDDYTLVSYGEEINMAYQFFADEQYLYLLDNTRRNYNDGIIYRVDETGEPVMLECRIERKDNKNRIRSRIITDY